MTEAKNNNSESKPIINKPRSPFLSDPHNHRGQCGRKGGHSGVSNSVKKPNINVKQIRGNRGGDR